MARIHLREFGDRFTDLRPRVVQTLWALLMATSLLRRNTRAAMFGGAGPRDLQRYAEPRLTKLAEAFAALPESDDKRRCLDAVVSARRGLRAQRSVDVSKSRRRGPTSKESGARSVRSKPRDRRSNLRKLTTSEGGRGKEATTVSSEECTRRAAGCERGSVVERARRAGRRARGLRGGGVHLIYLGRSVVSVSYHPAHDEPNWEISFPSCYGAATARVPLLLCSLVSLSR